MAGYRVGSKAWVEHVKQRIIDTGAKAPTLILQERDDELAKQIFIGYLEERVRKAMDELAKVEQQLKYIKEEI